MSREYVIKPFLPEGIVTKKKLLEILGNYEDILADMTDHVRYSNHGYFSMTVDFDTERNHLSVEIVDES